MSSYEALRSGNGADARGVRSEWKDPMWKTLPSLRRGLTDAESHLRTILFGRNVIEVAARGTFALLVDEVLHPFYIFQVLSIALWAFDDYYCASSCGRAVRFKLTSFSARLRLCHRSHQYRLYYHDAYRDQERACFSSSSVRRLLTPPCSQNIERMREMSRFSCPVLVLRNGLCTSSCVLA